MDLVETALESRDRDILSLAVSILVRQGGEWVTANAERLIAHPNETVRAIWAGVLADLPSQQARQYLSQAIKQEVNDRIKAGMQKLLEGIA
jgi:HEAT repeat protein